MQTKHSTILTTLQNVQAFMETNANALGTLNASDSRRALDDLEHTLSTHAVTQAQGKRSTKAEVAKQRVLRNTLKIKFLHPIESIAAAQLPQVPDFTALKVPKGIHTSQKLIAAAVTMGEAAAKYAPTFIGAGMAPTFLQDLKAAADELTAGLTAKGTAKSRQIGATTGLKSAAKQAHKIVNQLDALIDAQLATNPDLLARWKAVKRFAGKTAAITGATIDSGAITSPPAASGMPAPASTVTQPTAGSATGASTPPASSGSTATNQAPSPTPTATGASNPLPAPASGTTPSSAPIAAPKSA